MRVSHKDSGSLSLLSDACQPTNLESWMGGYWWVGTGCRSLSVVTGWVVLPLLLGSLSLLSYLAWLAGGYRSVGVHWWASGMLGASFYHQHYSPTILSC